MNAKLKAALQQVALTSQSAGELAAKLLQDAPSSEADNLKAKIESLQAQIAELQLQVSYTDTDPTESDLAYLYESFRARLKEVNTSSFPRYGRAFFSPLGVSVRKVMAKALLEEADARGVDSPPLWVTVFSSGEL